MKTLRELEAVMLPAPWKIIINDKTHDLEIISESDPFKNVVASWPEETWAEMGREGVDLQTAAFIVACRNQLQELLDAQEDIPMLQGVTREVDGGWGTQAPGTPWPDDAVSS